jgi:hydroxymethylbilane synthase
MSKVFVKIPVIPNSYKGDFLTSTGTIATGSLRRQAQWWHKYPNHQVVDLRGNVNTRMQKLDESNWNGAVFAAAGLERINLKPENYINLDWMIPAPAQGAMLVVAMANDEFTKDAASQLNDIETEICTSIERQFLKTLEGGCTAPIGALAKYDEEKDTIEFKGVLFSVDGKQKLEIEKSVDISEWKKLGFHSAQEILNNGGAALMMEIKNELKK